MDDNKFDRHKYDDVKRRNTGADSFKNRAFNDHKKIKDKYSGNTLHYNNIDSYSTKHISNVDHVTALKELHERYSNDPNIKLEDIKEFGNSDFNLRVTSEYFNKSKSDLTNFQYLRREVTKDGKIDLDELYKRIQSQGTYEMLKDQAKSEISQFVFFNGRKIVNISEKYAPKLTNSLDTIQKGSMDFLGGSMESTEDSKMMLLTSTINQLCCVASGEKDLKTGIKDISKITGNIIITGGTLNIIAQKGSSSLNAVANNIIFVSSIIEDSFYKYLNGEINGDEFVVNVVNNGLNILFQTVGSFIGQTMIPIPIIGSTIGAVVVITVCNNVYKEYKRIAEELKDIDKYKKLEAKVNKIADEAIFEMKKQQKILMDMINNENMKWDKAISTGFNLFYEGTINNDPEIIAEGLDNILNMFNGNVKFKTIDEFDEFFEDSNNVLKL